MTVERRGGRPSLKELNDHVLQDVAVEWKNLGYQLLSNKSAVEIIEADHKGEGIEKCCQEMFRKWLDTQESARWDQLLKALRSPSVQLMYLASKLEWMLHDENSNHDTTEDENTEMKSTFDNWSISELEIIILMVAVIVAILYNFFSSINWMQFIDKDIIIVPAIVGLMLQSNFYFRKRILKVVIATSPVVRRIPLNNVASSVVKRFIAALTIENFTVKSDAFPFKATTILTILYFLGAICLYYKCRTFDASLLSLMILIASFNYHHFAERLFHSTVIFVFISFVVLSIVTGAYRDDPYEITLIGFFIFVMFWYSLLHDNDGHKIVYIIVILSATTFTHDLLLSFIEIHVVTGLLDTLLSAVQAIFFCMFVFRLIANSSYYIRFLMIIYSVIILFYALQDYVIPMFL